MNKDEIVKIVRTLVGSIDAYGEAHTDNRARSNLQVLGDVVLDLVAEIITTKTNCSNDERSSVDRQYFKCKEILGWLKEMLEEAE